MTYRLWIPLCGGLLAAVCLTPGGATFAETTVDAKAEVLARGPIHEAFAQPLDGGDAKPGPVAPKPPPEPPEEQLPEQKPEGDDVQWVPGYWQWDDERGEFVWVTGVWREPPPNRKWVPGAYRQSDNGYQWSSGYWAPEGQDGLNYLPPPPASVDEGPNGAAPDDSATWVPGCWVWRERYVWRPGYWLTCRPGWIWQPSRYVCTPAGYLYCNGYWDYPLESRGVLFAPVCFSARPAIWTPSFSVSIGCLPGALFVRSGHCSYFFGDYFHANYTRGGFTPWVDVRIGRGGCDPLWGYYRGFHAGRSYERDVRGLYADRFAGRAALPPRTLGQQNDFLRDRRDRGGQNITNINNVTVLRPLSESAPRGKQLVSVDRGERERQHRHANEVRQAATQRVKAERELIVKREAPTQANAAPRKVDVQVPRGQRQATTSVAPPPKPNKQLVKPQNQGFGGGRQNDGPRPQVKPQQAQPQQQPKPQQFQPQQPKPQQQPRPQQVQPQQPKPQQFKPQQAKPDFERPKQQKQATPAPQFKPQTPQFKPQQTQPRQNVPQNRPNPQPRFNAPQQQPRIAAPRPQQSAPAVRQAPSFQPRSAPSFQPRSAPSFQQRSAPQPSRGNGGGRPAQGKPQRPR